MMAAVQSYGWHGFRDMVQKEHHVQCERFLLFDGCCLAPKE
jgi:hypothetical protein